MKITSSELIIVAFISLSIWLSFSVKKATNKLQDAEKLAITLEQNLVLSNYQTTILQEALQINITSAPVSIQIGLPLLNANYPHKTIL